MTCRLWTMRTIKASLRTWYLIWYSLCREYPLHGKAISDSMLRFWGCHENSKLLNLMLPAHGWKKSTSQYKGAAHEEVLTYTYSLFLIFTFTLVVLVVAKIEQNRTDPRAQISCLGRFLIARLSKWRWNEQRNPPNMLGKRLYTPEN